MSDVDVVVVTYRSGETVRTAIEPLLDDASIRIIVVDNASSDGTLEILAELPVEMIALTENGGFAHGCNVGARAGDAPYVLFLNPDAQIDPKAVRTMLAELDREERIGAIAPRIVEPDGTLDFSLRRFPRLRSTFAQALFLHRVFPGAAWMDEVVRERSRYETARTADWVSGACVCVRRTVLEQIGGLDEGFFHYSEDIDLCARIWQAGYEVRYLPSAVATHEGGASTPRARLLPILAASRIRYSVKHDGAPVSVLVRAGVALGSLTHAVLGRGGSAARRGHLHALAVALKPLPAEPSRLVRGR